MGDAKVLDEGLAALPGRIRRSRQERGWTLERLAGETALSKAYLGRLETGERQPSLSALLALSRAFGCSVSDLVGEPSPTGEAVVRGAAAAEQRGNGLRYRLLSPSDARGGIEAMRVVVPADRPAGATYEHAGQEWLYVLSGRLRLTLGDTEAVLETGDAAQFDARTPHCLAAAGDQDVELLMVAAPVAAPMLDSHLRSGR
ncbi:helix-turn-helix domain-containing protein [Spirillospora sp. CA-253888]